MVNRAEVEQRILEMKFDNKQFEQGIHQSIDSIDKFENRLQMTPNDIQGIQNVQRAFNNFSLDGVMSSIDGLQEKMSGLGIFTKRIIENIADDIYVGVRKVENAVTGVYNLIKTGGQNRAQNIEQAKFQLEGLHIAWADIEADINYAVKDTAFGLDSAAKAASQLSASDVKIGEEMKYALRGISGVAAMTNSTYDDIANIFTRVAGQGRVMAIDLNSIAARGINAAAELAKAMNTTEADIRDMVSKGKIDFKTFAKAMDDAFGTHAKEANKTYAGSLSNVKAALSRLGADIATERFEALRLIFNDLIPKLNEFKTEFKPVETAIREVIKKIGALIQRVIKSVDVPKIVNAIKKPALKAADAISWLADQFERAFKVAESFKRQEAFKKIQNDIDKVHNTIRGVNKEIDKITGKTKDEEKNLRDSNKELQAAQDIWNGTFGILNGQKRIDYIKDVLKLDPDTVQDYIDQFISAGNDWDKVVLKTGDSAEKSSKKYQKLSDIIQGIVNTFYGIKHVFDNVVESIKNIAIVFIDSFKEAFDFGGKTDISKLPETIAGWSDSLVITKDKAEKIKPVFDGIFWVVKKVADAVKWLADKIKDLIDWIRNNETLKTFATSVGTFFKTVFDNFKNLIDGVKNSEAYQQIKATLKPIITEIGDFVSFIFTNITAVFDRATDLVKDLSNGKSLFESISEFLFGTEQKRTALYGLIKGGFIVGFIVALGKALFKMSLFASDPIFYMFKFLGVLSNLSRVLVTYKYYLRANAFSAIAKGIGILVLSVVGMAFYINKYGAESVMQAALIIGIMVVSILAIMKWIGKIEKNPLSAGTMIKASITIRSIGFAVAAMAASIYFIASAMKEDGVTRTLGALVIAIGAMYALVGALVLLGNKMNDSAKLTKVATVMIAISVSILLISKAIQSMMKFANENDFNAKDIWLKAVLPILAIVGGMGLLVIGMSNFNKESSMFKSSLSKVAGVFLAMSVALVLIVGSIRSLINAITKSGLTAEEFRDAVLIPILGIMAMMTTCIAMMSIFGKGSLVSSPLTKVGGVMIAMSVAVALIVHSLVSILKITTKNGLEDTDIWSKGLYAVIGIIGALTGAIIAIGLLVNDKTSMFTPGKIASLGILVVGMAGAVVLIVHAIKSLVKTCREFNMGSAELALDGVIPILSIFLSISAVLMKMSQGKVLNLIGAAVSILVVAGAIAVLSATMGILAKTTDLVDLAGTVLTIVAVVGVIGLMGEFVSKAPGIILGMLELSAGIAAFSVSIGLLSVAGLGLSLVFITLGVSLPIFVNGLADSLMAIIKFIVGLVEQIEPLADAIGNAVEAIMYNLGKSIIGGILQLGKGIYDAFCETFGIHSPSTVFAELGKYLIEGLWKGIVDTIKHVPKKLGELCTRYIKNPFKKIFDINSPSGWGIDMGEFLGEGIGIGFEDSLKNFDTSMFTDLGDMFSDSMPDFKSLGQADGEDYISGLNLGIDSDLSKFDLGADLSGGLLESNKKNLSGIDWTKHLSLEDLIADPSKYDALKAVGEGYLTKVYEDYQEHAKFISDNATFSDYLQTLNDKYVADLSETIAKAGDGATYEDIEGLKSAFVKNYEAYLTAKGNGDQDVIDIFESTFMNDYILTKKLPESVTKYYKAVNDELAKQKDTEFVGPMKPEDFVPKADTAKSAIEKLTSGQVQKATVEIGVVDKAGNAIRNLWDSNSKGINLDYNDSSVKSNMDALGTNVMSSVNADTTELGNKLDTIERTLTNTSVAQKNHFVEIEQRITALESVFDSTYVRLDSGALVGKLTPEIDRAVGRLVARKARQ